MWSVLQTLVRKNDKKLVLYLGINIDEDGKYFMIFKDEDGNIYTSISNPEHKHTHIEDGNGKILIGRLGLNGYYFGKTLLNDLLPDTSLRKYINNPQMITRERLLGME